MFCVKKYLYKIKLFLFKIIFNLGLKLKSAHVLSIALIFIVSKLKNNKRPKILCIGRSIFIDDVRAMHKHSSQLEYLIISLSYWNNIFNHIVNNPSKIGMTDGNYHVFAGRKDERKEYYLFLKKLLPKLKKILGFKAVLSGNFNYMAQQELARVCEEENIPFIVLYKEGVVFSESLEDHAKQYQDNEFIGSKILFYNENIQEIMLQSSMPGLTKEKAECIYGVPRLDFYFFNEKTNNQIHTIKKIVFFSFVPRFVFRFQKLPEELLQKLDERCVEFHKFLFSFAIKHPDISITIKTKMDIEFKKYPQKILDENFSEKIPNLIITNLGRASDLILNSDVVLGFNSTVLLEALIVDKLIITPYFYDILPEVRDYFKNHQKLVNYVKSEKDMEKYILNNEQCKMDNNYKMLKKDILDKFFSVSEGGASKRVEAAIISELNE